MKVKDSGGLSPKKNWENLIVFPLFSVFFLLVCMACMAGMESSWVTSGCFGLAFFHQNDNRLEDAPTRDTPDSHGPKKITPKIYTLHGRNLAYPTWTKGKIIDSKKCLKGKGYVSSKESRGFSIPPLNNHAPMKFRGMNSPEDERNRLRPHLVVWIGGKHLSVQREIGNIKHGKP